MSMTISSETTTGLQHFDKIFGSIKNSYIIIFNSDIRTYHIFIVAIPIKKTHLYHTEIKVNSFHIYNFSSWWFPFLASGPQTKFLRFLFIFSFDCVKLSKSFKIPTGMIILLNRALKIKATAGARNRFFAKTNNKVQEKGGFRWLKYRFELNTKKLMSTL